jgi:outer membrane protein assembly factor BamB
MLKFVRVYLLALVALLLIGCGGSGGSAPTSFSGSSRKGSMEMAITWPDKGRYIPPYAEAIVFEGYLKSEPAIRFTQMAVRPEGGGTQKIRIGELLTPGTYVLAAAARSESDGSGATVASSLIEIQVKAGESAKAMMTLESTIASLRTFHRYIQVGKKVALSATAIDPEGLVILIPPDALTWKKVGGTADAIVTASGEVTASTPGSLVVEAAESGARISAEFTLTAREVGSTVDSPGATMGGPERTRYVDVDAPTGSLVWSETVPGIVSSPAVSGTGEISIATITETRQLDLVLLDRQRNLRRFSMPDPNDLLGFSRNAEIAWLNNDSLILLASRFDGFGTVFCVDTTDGSIIWERESGMISSRSTLSHPAPHVQVFSELNLVVVPSRDGLMALDLDSGLQLWSSPLPNRTGLAVAQVSPETLVVIWQQFFGKVSLLTLDARSGSSLRQSTLDLADTDTGGESVAVHDGLIYASVYFGRSLFVLDPATHQILAQSSQEQSVLAIGPTRVVLYGGVFEIVLAPVSLNHIASPNGSPYSGHPVFPLLFREGEVLAVAELSGEPRLILYEPFDATPISVEARWTMELPFSEPVFGYRMEAGPDGSVVVVTDNYVHLVR